MDVVDLLLAWPVFGLVVPILVGAGFAVLAFDEFRAAKFCFWLSAILIWGKAFMWLHSDTASLPMRTFLAFLIFGIAGATLIAVSEVVAKREAAKAAAPASTPGSGIGDIVAGDKVLGDKVAGNKIVSEGPDTAQTEIIIRRVAEEFRHELRAEYPNGYQVLGLTPKGAVVPSGEIPRGVSIDWTNARIEEFTDDHVTFMLPEIVLNTAKVHDVRFIRCRAKIPVYPLRTQWELIGGIRVEVLGVSKDLIVVGVGIHDS